MNEKEERDLKQAFNKRWSQLKSKWFKETYKEEMWAKLLNCYNSGFKCAYCGVEMSIYGWSNKFSIEHKENGERYNESFNNLEIICIGCNMLKRSLSKGNFLKIISALTDVYGKDFYMEIKREMYEGIQRGLKHAQEKGKICHRPRKEINIERAHLNIKKGLTLEEVAVIEKVSYSTLRNRLRERKKKV